MIAALLVVVWPVASGWLIYLNLFELFRKLFPKHCAVVTMVQYIRQNVGEVFPIHAMKVLYGEQRLGATHS